MQIDEVKTSVHEGRVLIFGNLINNLNNNHTKKSSHKQLVMSVEKDDENRLAIDVHEF